MAYLQLSQVPPVSPTRYLAALGTNVATVTLPQHTTPLSIRTVSFSA